jgi:hypothetical protein
MARHELLSNGYSLDILYNPPLLNTIGFDNYILGAEIHVV